MKLKSIQIKNIGLLKDVYMEINTPLVLFYGDIMQGKTTILKAIKYCLGGTFPEDILSHGDRVMEGFIILKFDHASIKREFYKSKTGIIKARKIKYIYKGELQSKPTEAIKQFLNPLLLDQDFFIKKSALERKKYFLQLFEIDTDELDQKIKTDINNARDTRIKINMYGDIDINPIEKIDMEDKEND